MKSKCKICNFKSDEKIKACPICHFLKKEKKLTKEKISIRKACTLIKILGYFHIISAALLLIGFSYYFSQFERSTLISGMRLIILFFVQGIGLILYKKWSFYLGLLMYLYNILDYSLSFFIPGIIINLIFLIVILNKNVRKILLRENLLTPSLLNYNQKKKKAFDELSNAGISKFTYAPPYYRLLWFLKIKLPPPHFSSSIFLFIFHGVLFCLLFMALSNMVNFFILGNNRYTSLPLILSVIFGLISACKYRSQAKQLVLPLWKYYDDKKTNK